MESNQTNTPDTDRPRRVLAVADWSLDPHVVVAALSAHDQGRPTLYGLLVPASLHGVDWAGEPNASRPCAARQLRDLQRLCRNAGIPIGAARIGDPEAAPAIGDVIDEWPADEILLFARGRKLRLPRPLELARRVERATRIPVTRIGVTGDLADTRRSRTAPHCRSSAQEAAR
jgi:hypothetical protein